MSRYWYAFIGPDGDEALLSNYQLVSNPCSCDEGYHLCAILSTAGGLHPDQLSQNLINYIAVGKQQGTHQPELPISSKLFVYMMSS